MYETTVHKWTAGAPFFFNFGSADDLYTTHDAALFIIYAQAIGSNALQETIADTAYRDIKKTNMITTF